MSPHPFIAFEGPIASGKTTHAGLLAQQLGLTPILEEFPDNEFLADSYGDQERWALPMQLSFLAMRAAQLRKIVPPLKEAVIVDYSRYKLPPTRGVSLQVPFHFETPEPEEIVRNVFLVFVLLRPVLEWEGAFIICRRQSQLLDDLLKGGRSDKRGLDVRFAPIRVTALLRHRKPSGSDAPPRTS